MKKTIITTALALVGAFFLLLIVSDDAENRLTLAGFVFQKAIGFAGLFGVSKLWDYLKRKQLTIL